MRIRRGVLHVTSVSSYAGSTNAAPIVACHRALPTASPSGGCGRCDGLGCQGSILVPPDTVDWCCVERGFTASSRRLGVVALRSRLGVRQRLRVLPVRGPSGGRSSSDVKVRNFVPNVSPNPRLSNPPSLQDFWRSPETLDCTVSRVSGSENVANCGFPCAQRHNVRHARRRKPAGEAPCLGRVVRILYGYSLTMRVT